MIEINNVSFKYKSGKEVLKDINFNINDGEIVSIIGNNGAGKSTLLKIIAGIAKPSNGSVIVDGLDAYKKSNVSDIRKKVGIVFQNPDNQILFNNVFDEVKFALDNLNIDSKDEKVKEALSKVGMEEHINSDTFKLSLGQKQRVNIASALAVEPKYLLLDEPTTMIDSNGKEKIYKIIDDLKGNKQTIVFITNNINEILIADRIVVLDEGKIVQILNKKDIVDNISLLEKYDIYIPDIIKLIVLLKEKGIKIDIEKYSVDKLAQKIIEELNR